MVTRLKLRFAATAIQNPGLWERRLRVELENPLEIGGFDALSVKPQITKLVLLRCEFCGEIYDHSKLFLLLPSGVRDGLPN